MKISTITYDGSTTTETITTNIPVGTTKLHSTIHVESTTPEISTTDAISTLESMSKTDTDKTSKNKEMSTTEAITVSVTGEVSTTEKMSTSELLKTTDMVYITNNAPRTDATSTTGLWIIKSTESPSTTLELITKGGKQLQLCKNLTTYTLMGPICHHNCYDYRLVSVLHKVMIESRYTFAI